MFTINKHQKKISSLISRSIISIVIASIYIFLLFGIKTSISFANDELAFGFGYVVMSTEKLPTVTAEKLPTPKLVNL